MLAVGKRSSTRRAASKPVRDSDHGQLFRRHLPREPAQTERFAVDSTPPGRRSRRTELHPSRRKTRFSQDFPVFEGECEKGHTRSHSGDSCRPVLGRTAEFTEKWRDRSISIRFWELWECGRSRWVMAARASPKDRNATSGRLRLRAESLPRQPTAVRSAVLFSELAKLRPLQSLSPASRPETPDPDISRGLLTQPNSGE